MKNRILIGSTFPLSLIRKQVVIKPKDINVLKENLLNAQIFSFWGHSNTLKIANKILGYDLTPLTERPALKLNDEKLPILNGISFDKCWILSPNYIKGFRPQIGVEVTNSEILDWEILEINWSKK